MTFLEAVLLGIVQGLTEFLPISSSAHLTITGKLLGLISPTTSESWTAFMAVIQLGTLIAVVAYFLKDIGKMSSSLWTDVRTHGVTSGFRNFSQPSKLALLVMLGTVPMGVIGVTFSSLIHSMFTKSTLVISSSLIGLAVLLWISERVATHKRELNSLTWVDALVVGTAQALALIPGSSRSGTTLTAGLFLNLKRDAAARFSFLLSIPAVAASGLYEFFKIHSEIGGFGLTNVFAATIASAVVGYASIAWLLRYLSTHTTLIFVVYRILLGIGLFVALSFGLIQL